MPKVSIVVPVYKVEQYLDRCVSSLIAQTLKDIEIILVDDGSPDGCPQMCDEWKIKDDRIKVVHKSNGGLSSARNAGIRIATGQYIGFVDSDDTVSIEMYQKLHQVIEQHQVDFVMSDYIRVSQDGSEQLTTKDLQVGKYNKSEIVEKIYSRLIMGENLDYGPLLSVWPCLYRMDFLHNNQIEFQEDVRWSEDNLFSALVGAAAQSFYYLKNEGLYHYYQNFGTISTTFKPGAWEVYLLMNQYLENRFASDPSYDFSQQLKWHLIYYACNVVGHASSMDVPAAMQEIKKVLRSEQLKQAFRDCSFQGMSFKLRLQLHFMKLQWNGIVYRILKMKSAKGR